MQDNYKLRFTSEQIAVRIAEMCNEIGEWAAKAHKRDGRDVVAVPVLRGGIFFFADLVRSLSLSVDIVPIESWGYLPGQNARQQEHVRVNLGNFDPQDRTVLLIDDICDSGRTLAKLERELVQAGVNEVKSAVLIRRIVEPHLFVPRWIGFDYEGSEWFVGYGMDDKDRWRNLPDVYVLDAGER